MFLCLRSGDTRSWRHWRKNAGYNAAPNLTRRGRLCVTNLCRRYCEACSPKIPLPTVNGPLLPRPLLLHRHRLLLPPLRPLLLVSSAVVLMERRQQHPLGLRNIRQVHLCCSQGLSVCFFCAFDLTMLLIGAVPPERTTYACSSCGVPLVIQPKAIVLRCKCCKHLQPNPHIARVEPALPKRAEA